MLQILFQEFENVKKTIYLGNGVDDTGEGMQK